MCALVSLAGTGVTRSLRVHRNAVANLGTLILYLTLFATCERLAVVMVCGCQSVLCYDKHVIYGIY